MQTAHGVSANEGRRSQSDVVTTLLPCIQQTKKKAEEDEKSVGSNEKYDRDDLPAVAQMIMTAASALQKDQKQKETRDKNDRKRKKQEKKRKQKEEASSLPGPRRTPAELCHMKGTMRTSYGSAIEIGAFATGKWAYLREHLSTAHAIDFKYNVACIDHNVFKFTGWFYDDSIIYGEGVKREDTFELIAQAHNDFVFAGQGVCNFYGPYLCDGTIIISEDKRHASFTVCKRDQSKMFIPTDLALLEPKLARDQKRYKEEFAIPSCLPGCLCNHARHQEQILEHAESAMSDEDNEDDDELSIAF